VGHLGDRGLLDRIPHVVVRRDKPAWRRGWKSLTPKG
jgi:hypothetical protein